MSKAKMLSYVGYLLVAAILVLSIVPVINLDALSSSTLLLSDSRPTQASVTYQFTSDGFTTGTAIQCIELDLGTNSDGTGDAGVGVGSATLDANTIDADGTWTVASNDTTDVLQATTAGGQNPDATSGSITWGSITNGSTADTTYFGVFTTYTDASCTGGNEVDTAVVTFIYKNGTLVSLTIDPTLSFSIASVTSGTTVNGASTTVNSGATSIDFQNSVTSGSPGVSAHDLTIGTNATGGYTAYIKHTGLLTNGASDTIDNWTGTNLSPAGSFPTTAEAWGYTTEDSSLSAIGDGADRFTNPGNEWAGFSTTNQEVAFSATPVSGELTQVGHQVSVASSTEAGTYQTTIVYTVASTY